MLLLAVADALVVAALVIVLPPMARRLPDCRRSWQLRWSRSSQVRPELIASLRRGRPAATPALARDVLEYVAIMRRGLALLRSDAYRICGLLFTAAGIVGMVNGVHRDSAEIVLPPLITATYPLWTWA